MMIGSNQKVNTRNSRILKKAPTNLLTVLLAMRSTSSSLRRLTLVFLSLPSDASEHETMQLCAANHCTPDPLTARGSEWTSHTGRAMIVLVSSSSFKRTAKTTGLAAQRHPSRARRGRSPTRHDAAVVGIAVPSIDPLIERSRNASIANVASRAPGRLDDSSRHVLSRTSFRVKVRGPKNNGLSGQWSC